LDGGDGKSGGGGGGGEMGEVRMEVCEWRCMDVWVWWWWVKMAWGWVCGWKSEVEGRYVRVSECGWSVSGGE